MSGVHNASKYHFRSARTVRIETPSCVDRYFLDGEHFEALVVEAVHRERIETFRSITTPHHQLNQGLVVTLKVREKHHVLARRASRSALNSASNSGLVTLACLPLVGGSDPDASPRPAPQSRRSTELRMCSCEHIRS